ncbi:penicillin-binding protein 2 [Anabaena cylindrica FACHB-243]|uniref:Peptidoglycan glycosyltransferase n=1 Tax=Anabaena cylindrica (strain ATCC 27899 / PCC 7122) TaxID=272123 RepID=K9ZP24_ANACC|nr:MULTISPECIES: penicillin-binding protein 2 [Anabaena]AFZ60080.1 Peptidoglycan glycosyltransferase [Anabaena cylindrica PCC 7122]MBD2417864.1 penicillin-binding protein 2 [Anabaena cylindrica FACHB-243]MBY5282555.1 penicillin-binding protein 2 [Anabaena sp. CCAP 1446/1C]MBY5310708.1 penicillin-binding protein 2 [Anabaena sp. CCAP 1446/1C]MCM2404779.1 penicillin-binding protein 2 [Anabaena sp. CCAP 1446/1C]
MQKSPSRTKFKNLQNLEFTRQRKFFRQVFPGNDTPKTQAQVPNLKSRLLIAWSVLIAGGMGLALNLYRLQILQGSKLTERARSQQMVNLRPFMPRRSVVDRNDNILAIDRPVYTLYAHPKLFDKSNEEMAKQIAPVLGKDADNLVKIFKSRKSGILLSNSVAENIADRIISFRLNGLELIEKYSRFYPQGDLVANVVGYVNLDRRGQAGVEYSQEKLLERSVQTIRLSRAGNGALMPNHAPEGFLHFDDLKLQLTIDSRLQRAARTALKKQIDKFQAKRGAVIVMDARDGSLLALVSQPTYNANQYSKADISLFKNWIVADLYEPGSTFKPLNIAIALENGAIKPDDVFSDPGTMKVADRIIKNAEKNAPRQIDIAQILQHSSNVGMVKIIQRMRPSIYYNWLERLGLGQKVDTDLPFEVGGRLKSQEEFLSSTIEPATTSFGQGFSLTPLQLVQMHGALANGGKLVTPHIVQGLIDSQGKMHYSPTLPTPRQIFSPTTAQKVVDMMETVVSVGTGKASKINGYGIAGKTGTAEKASPNGGYIPGARITSFVGILPAEAPRYVVVAIVDEPKGANAYGGTVAAPIVKAVMEVLIPMEKIPPKK